MAIQAPHHPFPFRSLHKGICNSTCCPAAAAAALIPSNFLLHFTFLQRFDGFFGASCMADAAVPAPSANLLLLLLLLVLVLPLMTARGCRDEVVVQCRVRAGSHNDDDDAA